MLKPVILIMFIVFLSSAQPLAKLNAVPYDSTYTTSIELQKKSLYGAYILETFVPTLGFLYAGDWKKGLLPEATKFGGIVIAFSQVDLNLLGGETEIRNDFIFGVGVLMTIAGFEWTYSRLADLINEHNFKVEMSTRQSAHTKSNYLSISIAYMF